MSQKKFRFYTILITLGGFFLFLGQTALSMDIINVILPSIEVTRGWSADTLNYVLSIATAAGIITPIVFGTIFIKLGLKRVLIGSVVVIGAATILMGCIEHLAVFTICMFLVQFIAMAVTIGFIGVVGNWFMKTKGRVLGVVTIAAPFSTALFTPFATWLLNQAGFTMMFVIIGAVWLVVGLALMLAMPERPELVGLHVDNDSTGRVVTASATSKWKPKDILKKKEAWLLIFGFGVGYLMSTSIMSQFVTYMQTRGLSNELALFVLSAAAIGGMPFSYLWGWLDDRISTPKAAALLLLTFTITSVSMLFAGTDNLPCAFVAGLGIAATTGGMPNLIPSSISWVFGGTEYVNVNRTIGTFHLSCRSLAFLLVASVSYTTVFTLFIPLSLLAAFALFRVRVSYDSVGTGKKGNA